MLNKSDAGHCFKPSVCRHIKYQQSYCPPNPHTLPAAHCPLTTKQQDRDSERLGHKRQREIVPGIKLLRNITVIPLN